MVAVPAPLPTFTFEEYLRLDDVSDQRFEWVAGQVYAMAGGTDRHLATVQALFTRIAPLARAAGCRPWMADRRLRTAHASYYPDLFVVCGPRADRMYETDAAWVVEVLSPSTASTDLREKAPACAGLSGIRQYVVVDPDTRTVRLGVPDADDRWSWAVLPANGILDVMGGRVDLAEVWAEVDEVAPDDSPGF
jgi:Uma2 family endonuclease